MAKVVDHLLLLMVEEDLLHHHQAHPLLRVLQDLQVHQVPLVLPHHLESQELRQSKEQSKPSTGSQHSNYR